MVGLPTGSTYVNFQNVIGSYAGANILVGDANDNTFTGGRAADSLSGGNGADTLIGNGGKDVLQGGAGIDTLTGGAGADTFVFTNDDGVNSGNNDTITDFSVLQKDKINLAAIDADTTLAGDQAFKFIADAAFTHHAGELRTSEEATADGLVNFLYGDTNGDGVADFAIKLLNDEVVTKADFIL
jgi:serralysin